MSDINESFADLRLAVNAAEFKDDVDCYKFPNMIAFGKFLIALDAVHKYFSHEIAAVQGDRSKEFLNQQEIGDE